VRREDDPDISVVNPKPRRQGEHQGAIRVAGSLGPRFVAIAVGAYGRPLDMASIRRAHLRTALTHRLWHGPGTPRHASIIAWIAAAFDELAVG
jgi:hypothetical protein